MGAYTPEDYAAKLAAVRRSADRAGRDPMAIVPALTQICLIGDDDEIAEMLRAPLVKSILLLLTAADLRAFGHRHPMGENWRGVQDFDPVKLSRENILAVLRRGGHPGHPRHLPVRQPAVRWLSGSRTSPTQACGCSS